ncbi:MAG: winged helix-turn-helix domain-containing protein [Acidobacteria bacterium]|nr:winged helix-turn-helix domain-containing protein [Acidobacteriota bacterium]
MAHRTAVARFGTFELDLKTGELRKSGIRLRLPNQSFQVLALLLEKHGSVVAREDLRRQLWRDDTFVDFERGLNRAVNKLREALCDSAEVPRFIETLPRRGYRFIGTVETHTARKPTVLVLPFANYTSDAKQEFFVDGMTEEMIAQLSRLNPQKLRVIARSTSAQYKDSTKPLDEIAAELDINYVLEGSVRRERSRVRITAQLIELPGQTHLWASSYDRPLKDSLTIQSEVAECIANSLAVELLPEQRALIARSSARDPEAYELYLHGRYHWARRTEEDFRKALAYFQKAIQKDPGYAAPYAGLADVYNMFGFWGWLPSREGFGLAKSAATAALNLDEKLAEAHSALGYAILRGDWDAASAEREHKRAIELNPNFAVGRDQYGLGLLELGRIDEALQEMEISRKLDPLSVVVRTHIGWAHYFARRYELAIQELEKTLALDSQFPLALYFLGMAYEQVGRYDDAIASVARATELSNQHPGGIAVLAHIHACKGERAKAAAQLARLRNTARERHVSPFFFALATVNTNPSQAVEHLEAAYKERSNWLIHLKLDPQFDVLRNNSAFQTLVAAIKLSSPIPLSVAAG